MYVTVVLLTFFSVFHIFLFFFLKSFYCSWLKCFNEIKYIYDYVILYKVCGFNVYNIFVSSLQIKRRHESCVSNSFMIQSMSIESNSHFTHSLFTERKNVLHFCSSLRARIACSCLANENIIRKFHFFLLKSNRIKVDD